MNCKAKRSSLWKRGPHICYYCKEELHSIQEATIDHLVPKIAGGSHALKNLVIACKPCNTSKGLMTEKEFLSLSLELRHTLKTRYKECYAQGKPQKHGPVNQPRTVKSSPKMLW